MKINKDIIKSIKETAYVVNGFTKTFRNPHNSFLWLTNKGNFIDDNFEQIKDNEYYVRHGNVGYTVFIKTAR